MNLDTFTWIASVLILLSPFAMRFRFGIHSMVSFATTFGILGTFLGIFLGLMHFDVNNIGAAVPLLLAGLKTAFLTSISGMTTGLILKIAPIMYGISHEQVKSEKEEATIGTLAKLLEQIESSITSADSTAKTRLSAIEKALCGEGDTTLLTQMQKMRATFADKQDDLIREFRTFAEKVVENGTEALVEALTQVMQDFNTKINEQFGDNFKRLNEAVGKMLEWQDEYRKQVEFMIRRFDTLIEKHEDLSASLEKIIQQSEAFANTATSLEDLMYSINEEYKLFKGNIEAFAKLGRDAREAMPMVEASLNRLTESFAKIVDVNSQAIGRQLGELHKQNELLSNAYSEVRRQITDSTQRVVSMMESSTKKNAEIITTQFQVLEDQMGKELTKAISTLGSQLASLSGKFVQDYEPLTRELQRLVQLSRPSFPADIR